MALKSLSDFGGNHKAYADYLESAEAANDEGYDVYVNVLKGDIYTPTNGDWTQGHGHNNVNDPRPERKPDDKDSIGRPWKNNWLLYQETFNLTNEEIELLKETFGEELFGYFENEISNGDKFLKKIR